MGVKITKSNSNSLSPAIKSKFTYKSEPISSTYILGKTIGSGRYGIVRKALKNDSSEIFAIKRIKKNPDRETCYLTREAEIMKELSHKNIVKLIDTYEDQHFFFLVIEFCQEGDLSRKLKNRQKFSEEIAKIYMNQILKAIDYLHKNNILHRDIKPGNIMIHKNNELKLADFGLSKRFDKCVLFKTRAGTLSYMAPEVIKRKYSHKCDM